MERLEVIDNLRFMMNELRRINRENPRNEILVKTRALKAAIEELESGGWIPVSEHLPKEPDICEVTVKALNGHIYTDSGYFDECKKEWWKHDDSGLLDVIAWRMPLLEPYKEEKRGSDDRKKPLYGHIKDKVRYF